MIDALKQPWEHITQWNHFGFRNISAAHRRRTCHSNMADSTLSTRQTTEDAQRALADLRLSLDGEQNGRPNFKGAVNGLNGRSRSGSPRSSGDFTGADRTSILQQELERVKEEKDALQTQYQNLVARLNNMRTTLGNKLKQDAVRAFLNT